MFFLCATLKSWEEPGDEANTRVCSETHVHVSHIPYATKFCWLKFSPKAHTLYIGTKILLNLISPITQVTFQEVVGGTRKLLVCVYAHVLTITCAKFIFLPTTCIGKIGENFLLAKISTYTVILCTYVSSPTDCI